jgi:hypothetical protein
VLALYWAITTITTVGYGDILPTTWWERLYCIIAMLVGGAFYGPPPPLLTPNNRQARLIVSGALCYVELAELPCAALVTARHGGAMRHHNALARRFHVG